MNFKSEFEKGQRGQNMGMDTGIRGLNRAINGINMKSIYTIASAPKVGKSTLTDFSFVLSPYLEWMRLIEENGGMIPYPLRIIYYSFEIDRIQKEFKFASFFMYHDYGISEFEYNGITMEMDSQYLQGKKRDGNGDVILLSQDHRDKLMEIYEKRIIPLFGEWDENNIRVQKGIIHFIEEKTNPTGIRNDLIKYLKTIGTESRETYTVNGEHGQEQRSKVVGYSFTDPKQKVIVVIDHVRKLARERNFTMKDNIDKMSEYLVELRNRYGVAFVVICHSNRNLADPNRKRESGEFLFITSDDIKDSGNLSEDSDYVITMFNPNDDKFNLNKHFGVQLKHGTKILYPKYRSLHLVESRHTECPIHIQIEMFGGVNYLRPLKQ